MFIFSKRKERLEEMKIYSHPLQRRKKLEEKKKLFLNITKYENIGGEKIKLST
jgi:hypothetical protein